MPKLRPVDYRTLIRVFEQDGFAFNRQHGDHLIYTKAGVKRPLVIPTRNFPCSSSKTSSVRQG